MRMLLVLLHYVQVVNILTDDAVSPSALCSNCEHFLLRMLLVLLHYVQVVNILTENAVSAIALYSGCEHSY